MDHSITYRQKEDISARKNALLIQLAEEQLIRLAEMRDTLSDADVRILHLAAMRAIAYRPDFPWLGTGPVESWLAHQGVIFSPGDRRILTGGAYTYFQIPAGFINDSLYEDVVFEGGLYAVISCREGDEERRRAMLERWIEEGGVFEIDVQADTVARQYLTETLTDWQTGRRLAKQADLYIPVRFSAKYGEQELRDASFTGFRVYRRWTISPAELLADPAVSCRMVENGLCCRFSDGYHAVRIQGCYPLPLRIDWQVFAGDSPLRLEYGKGHLLFNNTDGTDRLQYSDPCCPYLPLWDTGAADGRLEDGWHTVSWILERKYMAVTVDGSIRFCKTGFPYQKSWGRRPVREEIRLSSVCRGELTLGAAILYQLE